MSWFVFRNSGGGFYEGGQRPTLPADNVNETKVLPLTGPVVRVDTDDRRLAASGLMAVGAVHDFANIMQVIASAIRVAERGMDAPAADKARPFLRAALASVDKAAELSRRVLGFSQAASLSGEVARLGDALAELQRSLDLIMGPSISIDMVLGEQLPALFCSIRELEDVLLNLVINARDAMPDGGRLCISADRGLSNVSASTAGPMAILRVTDTGCGMSPEQARRAFTPFFTTKPKGAGTGLGLALVGDFARRAGGSVEIETAVGLGTSVTLRLPACEARPDGR